MHFQQGSQTTVCSVDHTHISLFFYWNITLTFSVWLVLFCVKDHWILKAIISRLSNSQNAKLLLSYIIYMFTYQHETNLQWSLVSGLITFHLYVTYFPNKFTEHYIRNIRSCLHIRNCISSSTSVIILQAKAMENYCLTTSSYDIKNLKMETLPFLTHEDK